MSDTPISDALEGDQKVLDDNNAAGFWTIVRREVMDSHRQLERDLAAAKEDNAALRDALKITKDTNLQTVVRIIPAIADAVIVGESIDGASVLRAVDAIIAALAAANERAEKAERDCAFTLEIAAECQKEVMAENARLRAELATIKGTCGKCESSRTTPSSSLSTP